MAIVDKSVSANTVMGLSSLGLDAWKRQKVYIDQPLFEAKWTFDVPNRVWEEFAITGATRTPLASTGTLVTSTDNALCISSGSVAGSGASVSSKRSPAYQANKGHLYATAGYLPDPTADAVRKFGLFVNGNGTYFKLVGDGSDWELYAVRKGNGVEHQYPLKDLILARFPDFSPAYNNTYDIQFQWRSAGDYLFYINQKLIFVEENLGKLTALSIRTPAIPVNYEVITNDGTEVKAYFGCVEVASEGGLEQSRHSFSVSSGGNDLSFISVNKGSASGTATLAINVPRTIDYGAGTMENTRALIATKVATWTRDEAQTALWVGRDIDLPNLSALTWTQIPDSLNEYTVGGTGTALATAFNTDVANMTKIASEPEDIEIKNIITNPDQEHAPYYISPGDILVVSVKTVGAPTVNNTTTIYLSEEI